MAKKKIKGEDGKEYTVKEKKPFYKRWWFIALIVVIVFGAFAGSGDEGETEAEEPEQEEVVKDEEAEKETEKEGVAEEPQEDGLTNEEVKALEEDLKKYLEEEEAENDLSIHSFKYEDDKVDVWIDLQNDPLPTQEEAEDMLAGVTWRLAELTEVETSDYYDVNALLVSETDGGFIHWLTDRFRNGDYEMTEEEAFEILPN